jgi:hypothetical protein
MDIELALPVGFLVLATAGLVYAGFAAYLYFRFERGSADNHVPVAISVFAMFYATAFGQRYERSEVFLPLLLRFLMALTLVLVIWLGLRARSRAGRRITLAGLLTLAAFVCRTGHYIYQSAKLGWR